MKNDAGTPIEVIEEELATYEVPEKERDHFLSLVSYGEVKPRYWCTGPHGKTRDEVYAALASYSGATEVRIYRVRVPR